MSEENKDTQVTDTTQAAPAGDATTAAPAAEAAPSSDHRDEPREQVAGGRHRGEIRIDAPGKQRR